MKTNEVILRDLSKSVIAVPPLARHDDLSLNRRENGRLIGHIEDGGITTLMYGGNANFYNVPLSEYAETLAFLSEAVADDTWLIPSAGPDYGRLIDQAKILSQMSFPVVMALPQIDPATPVGVETALRRFCERLARPIILYVKRDNYLSAQAVGRLVDDGLVFAIKYAVVCPDPAQDAYLRALLDKVDARRIISGIGERPAVVHLGHFGLQSFTTGSGTIAPRASLALLRTLQSGDEERAATLRRAFLPLEDCRDRINPVRVLHDAVTLSGIADMGPILPHLHNLDAAERDEVKEAARALLSYDTSLSAAGL